MKFIIYIKISNWKRICTTRSNWIRSGKKVFKLTNIYKKNINYEIFIFIFKRPIGLIEKNLTDISVKSKETSFLSGAKEASIVSGTKEASIVSGTKEASIVSGKKASVASGVSLASGKKSSSRAASSKNSIHKSGAEDE